MKPSIRVAICVAFLASGAHAWAQSGATMTCTPSEASQHGSLQMQAKAFQVDLVAPQVSRSEDSAPVHDLTVSDDSLKFSDFVAGVGDVHWQIDRHSGAFRAQITLIPANVRADPVFLGQCSGLPPSPTSSPPSSATSAASPPAPSK